SCLYFILYPFAFHSSFVRSCPKFISSYTASKIPVLEKTNNTSLTKFIEQADKKWDLFEKFMEENQLSTVDFSKAKFEKRFVFGIVKEENK
ncbi:MAG: hypothetical protein IJC57_03670, partial [Clostridia bacterium]|nr:hypothetical protein [Clostridia bacterium]